MEQIWNSIMEPSDIVVKKSMPATMKIPPGYRFNPTDQVLIKDYLFKKATGMLSSQIDFIPEKNLYGQNADPWNVFNNLDYLWGTCCSGPKDSNTYVKKSTYVFTKLYKVSGKKRITRTAGCGTWHGETAGKKIYDQSTGEEIGTTKMFTFQSKKAVSGDDHWIMHEYSLSGVSSACGLKYQDYVICKITRCLSKEKYDREEKQRFSGMHVNDTVKDYLLGKKRSAREEEAIELEDEGSRFHKKQCTAKSGSEDDGAFAAELEQDLLADGELNIEEMLAAKSGSDEAFAAELEQDLLADGELNIEEMLAAKSGSDEAFAAELEQDLLADELNDEEMFGAELENLLAGEVIDDEIWTALLTV